MYRDGDLIIPFNHVETKCLLNLHDQIITLELVADVNHDVGNLTAGGGRDVGLHLHGGKGGNRLTLLDLIADLDQALSKAFEAE